MVSDHYDGQTILGGEYGLNFLIFVLVEENPGKTSTRKLTRPESEPGPAGPEATTLPLVTEMIITVKSKANVLDVCNFIV